MQNSSLDWSIIKKTLEAADRAPPVVEQPKPTHRVLQTAAKSMELDRPSSKPPSRPPSRPPSPPQMERSQPVASSSRPVIKLKVGSHPVAPKVDTPERPVVPSVTKPVKRKKESPIEVPPPPYVDDGSHDILQEVLAIEREKNVQRQRSTVEKNTSIPTVSLGKRKAVEEDILELATTTKKERHSPAGPSAHKATTRPPPSAPKSSAVPSIKIKKDKPTESPHVTPANSRPPTPSLKGKEREYAPPDPSASVPPPAPAQNLKRKAVTSAPMNEKKCKELLKTLIKLPESAIFLRPVDTALDGCPT